MNDKVKMALCELISVVTSAIVAFVTTLIMNGGFN